MRFRRCHHTTSLVARRPLLLLRSPLFAPHAAGGEADGPPVGRGAPHRQVAGERVRLLQVAVLAIGAEEPAAKGPGCLLLLDVEGDPAEAEPLGEFPAELFQLVLTPGLLLRLNLGLPSSAVPPIPGSTV